MIGQAFHPDARVCKLCDLEIRLDPRMREGDDLKCLCGAMGKLAIFVCWEPGCDCGGWWGIAWKEIDYDKGRKTGMAVFETFMREANAEG